MSYLYHPSPLEEAYGRYLLETCFQISDPSVTTTLAISGRLAVPFFTKSQVNRLILRNIWSTVDPTNQGTLATLSQFQTCLRLIALAQQNVVQQWLAQAFQNGPPQVSPVVAMQACLQATQNNVIPLPHFDGIDIPDATMLQNRYHHHHHQRAAIPGDVDFSAVVPGTGGFLPADSMTMTPNHLPTIASMNDPFGRPHSIVNSLPQSSNDPYMQANNRSPMSELSKQPTPSGLVDDPFGTLIRSAATTRSDPFPPSVASLAQTGFSSGTLPLKSQDVSLPSVGSTVQAPFGSDRSATTTTTTTMDISNAFGGLVEVSDEPLPSLSTAATTTTGPAVDSVHQKKNNHNMGKEEDDAFGDFGDAGGVVNPPSWIAKALQNQMVVVPSSNIASTTTTLQHESSSQADEFGDFCGSEEFSEPPAAAPATATSADDPAAKPSVWGFGVELTVTEGFAPVTQVASGDWDALDALADIPDAPLPSLTVPQPELEPQDEMPALQDRPVETSVEDESFGDFETIEAEDIIVTAQEPGANPPPVDGTIDNSEELQPTVSLESAKGSYSELDAMESDETGIERETSFEGNALCEPATVSNESADITELPTIGLHGFGISLHAQGLSALDAFGELENAPLPSLSQFGAIAEPMDSAEIVSSQQGDLQDESEGFGDFVGLEQSSTSQGETLPMQNTGLQNSEAIDQVASVSDDANDADGFEEFVSSDKDDAFREINVTTPADEPLEARNDIFPSKSWGGSDAALAQPFPFERQLSAPTSNALISTTKSPQFEGTNVAILPAGEAIDLRSFSAPAAVESIFDAFDGLPVTKQDVPLPHSSAETFAVAEVNDFIAGNTVNVKERLAVDAEGTHIKEGTYPSSMDKLHTFPGNVVSEIEIEGFQSDNRLESDYFSASGSTSDDLDGFESAVETDEEGPASTDKNEGIQGHHGRIGSLGNATTGAVVADNDDPFAVFDELSAPPPVLLSGTMSTASIASPSYGPNEFHRALDAPTIDSNSQNPPSDGDVASDFVNQDLFNQERRLFDGATKVGQMLDSDVLQSVSSERQKDVTEPSESDTFGDFETADFEVSAQVREETQDIASKGDRAPSPTTMAEVDASFEPDDSFGDFATSHPIQPVPSDAVVLSEDATPPELASERIPGTEPNSEVASQAHNDDEDDFGDFASFSKEPATPQPAIPISSLEASEKEKLMLIRQLVVDHSLRLPEAIRRQTDGSQMDFGNCFDANVGVDVPVSMERKARTQTSLQLIALLTTSHVKLGATVWEQSLAVIKTELNEGCSLLQEAKGFAPIEEGVLRTKLELYVHGLGEFVRVSRSIVATVGDLLMLDPSDLFTADTLVLSWCNLDLLHTALEIERLWKAVESSSEELGLSSKQESQRKLPSVEDLRKSSAAASRDKHVCELTLQPISSIVPASTISPVKWEKRAYMACCANFLQHKCSFYAIDSIM